MMKIFKKIILLIFVVFIILETGLNIGIINAEETAEEANATGNDMMNAYKSIPSATCTSAAEINRFVKSDTSYNEAKNTYKQSVGTLKEWRNVLNKGMTDTITRKEYYTSYQELGWIINDKQGTITEEEKGFLKNIKKDIEESYKEAVRLTLEYAMEVSGSRDKTDFNSILDDIDSYNIDDDLDDESKQKLEASASKILTVITNIGIVVTIIIIAVIGIKYMMGSLEEKAEYKKDLPPIAIGAVLLFGISVFVKIFMQIGNSIIT